MTEIGKIDINGYLSIERVNREVPQECPYRPGLCGHHCPFFEELDNVYDGEHGNRGNLKSRRISVCGRVIEITKDERE